MPTRRPILKRVALWTAAVVLVLAGYLASLPFVDFVDSRYPVARPVLVVLYSPILLVIGREDAPGHDLYIAYLEWAREHLEAAFN